MPHEQPWLNDYQARHQAELQARWDEEAKIFNIQNLALKAAINCPFPIRSPEMCANCGESSCVKAWKEQQKLWQEDPEEPVYPASTTSTRPAATSSPAQSGLTAMQTSRPRGLPASGSETDLFALINRQREDEEAAA
jgi:hypothetical protein